MTFGLFPQHKALLQSSGITSDVAQVRGYVSCDVKATLARFGFGKAQRLVPGLLVPVHNVTGKLAFHQYRPDSPRLHTNGKAVKYETPRGVRMALDVHPHARPWLADLQRPLFITEGVRKADAAVSRGLCCIALLGVWNWRGRNERGGLTALADWELIALNGRSVYVAFDSDVMMNPQVHTALTRLRAFLEMRGAHVALIYLPAGPDGQKAGLDDYFAAGHTVEDLLALATTEVRTPPASPEAAPSTRIPPPAPAPPVEALDRLLAEARPVGAEEPKTLAAVLADVASFLRRFVAFTSTYQVTAVTLWAAATHAVEAAEITLYLIITSPEMRSGKTLLLKLLRLLVPRPWAVVCPSEAVVYRKIAAETPTLLLDEVDAIFKDKTDRYEGLRALLNAGNERGATVPRCVGEGTKQQVVEFPVFCPKALAGIGALPVTVADRGVPIRLQRRAPHEKIEKARRRELAAVAAPIKAALEQWAAGAVPLLRDARPDIPDVLNDRAADGWELSLAIADLAGGDWPRLAREAAGSLHGDAMAQEETVGVALLAALREIFEAMGAYRLPTADMLKVGCPTADMLKALVDRDDGPWAEWWGKDVDIGRIKGPAHRLARLLRPFGIRPRDLRTSDGTKKGYCLTDFADTFRRYLLSPAVQERDNATMQMGPAFQPSPYSPAEETTRRLEAAPGLDCRLVALFEAQHEDVGGNGPSDPVPEVIHGVPREVWNGLPPLIQTAADLLADATIVEVDGEPVRGVARAPEPLPDDGRQALPPWYRPDLGFPLPHDDGRRVVFLRAGEALGWRAVPYKPGNTIKAGEEHWRTFAAASSDEEIVLALQAIEQLEGGE